MKAIFVTTCDTFFLSHRLALALALKQVGFDVAIAAASTGAASEIERKGLRFIPLPLDRRSMSPWREARVLASIAAMYHRERPDLIHHSSIKPMLYGSFAARALGMPAFVNTVSGLGYALTKRSTDSYAQRALRTGVSLGYRIALRGRNSWNIFQNPDQLERFVTTGLANRERSVLIRGAGVDTTRFVPTPLPEGTPRVVLPARMLWDKGIGEFVTAARALQSRGVRATFVLVGGIDPGNRAAIPRETVDQWVREKVVEWWGHRDKMQTVFAQAHLVVLPSYAEGLPLALAEAAAAGRACITTDVPGCRETVLHGRSGFLVPVHDTEALANAIEKALENPDQLIAMGARGREHAMATLSQDRVVADTFKVLRRLGVPVPE